MIKKQKPSAATCWRSSRKNRRSKNRRKSQATATPTKYDAEPAKPITFTVGENADSFKC